MEHLTSETETADPVRIQALMDDLVSPDSSMRLTARQAIRTIGEPALPALHQLLRNEETHARWEAAKVLAALAHPDSAEPLAAALDDEDSGIRWLAATGLLAVGREGALAVLRSMVAKVPSARFRRAAHHVLHDLRDRDLGEAVTPVLEAIEHGFSAEHVTLASHEVLALLESRCA